MKLSIIVPVYNVEKYVERCIKSVLRQKLYSNDDFEVIIINDGSQDNSMSIVNEIVESYANVIIINQENRGLSVARNVGLQNSSGDYVWFVDSDDWIEPDSINTILSVFNSNDDVDIISFQLNSVVEDTSEVKTSSFSKYLDKVDIIAGSEYIFLNGAFAPVQRFAFRKEFLMNHNFTFYPGIYHEDGEFGMRVLYSSSKVFLYKKPLYNYMLRNKGSIMSSKTIKNTNDLMIVYNSLKRFGETNVIKEDKRYWNAIISKWFYFMFSYSRKFIKSQEFKDFYFDNKQIINKNVLSVFHLKKFSYKASVVALLIRFFPSLYVRYLSCH